MLSREELSSGLRGALGLMRGDPAAMAWFDRSPRGFWRSFWVAALLLPPQAVLVALHLDDIGVSTIGWHTALLETGFYAIDWLLLPAIVGEIALRLGRVPQFAGFVIASNYAQIPIAAIWLVTAAIALLLPVGAAAVIQLVVLALTLAYQLRIARIAFDLELPPAILLVAAAFVLSLMTLSIADHLVLAGQPVLH